MTQVYTDDTIREIIEKVQNIVAYDREITHGNRKTNHDNIAKMWSSYLDKKITGLDVALMMVLLKTARTKTGSYNPDDFIDMAGYSVIAGELAEGVNNNND
jgi:uncharacterized phage protein gp47/JayE